MRVTIRGKRWDLYWVTNLGKYGKGYMFGGDCDAPTTTAKVIRVRRAGNKGFDQKDELDHLLHELWHAGHWDVKEEVVDELATLAATIFWELGYRRAKQLPRKERAAPIPNEITVILRGLLRAAHRDVKSEVTDEMATDVAVILWKLGYRKEGLLLEKSPTTRKK